MKDRHVALSLGFLAFGLFVALMTISLLLPYPNTPRTLSTQEENWVVSCISHAYVKVGAQKAKDGCMSTANELYELGMFE